jgi:uncharacterized protein with NRDE domain
MCLILLAWRSHPRYSLVLAANRDEFHIRAAQPAHWWTDRPRLLAGRDLAAGGTWLGLTRAGQVAALTNFRSSDPAKPSRRSRGEIVVDMLHSGASIGDRLARLRQMRTQYGEFNVICSDGDRLGVFESAAGASRLLDPGIYGLSNHLLDTPWRKVRQAKSKLAAALGTDPDDGTLLELLRDEEAAPDHELPRSGLDMEWERLLSSAFIRHAEYGTRCSTIIRIGLDGRIEFREWTWRVDGSLRDEVRFEFQSEGPAA